MLQTKNIGEGLLLYWRYQHAGTARGLARAIGVSSQTIHTWARGQPIAQRYWKKILEVTGLDLRQYEVVKDS